MDPTPISTTLNARFSNVDTQLANRYLKSETYTKADIDNLVNGVKASVSTVDGRVTSLVNTNTLNDLKPKTLWCADGTCIAPGDRVVANGPHQAKGDGLRHMTAKLNGSNKYQFALEADDEYLRFATFNDNGDWNGMHPIGIHRDGRVDVETNLNMINNAPISFGSGYSMKVLNWKGEDRLCIIRNGKVLAAFSDGWDHFIVPKVAGDDTSYMYFNQGGQVAVHPFPEYIRFDDDIRVKGNFGNNTKFLTLWGNDQQNINDDFVKVKIVRP
ncbi:hypothetical protein GGF31_003457 [Allomyces arbusculus]|nr:hypothetical protein GGF31_003457 [Allomyces arbusculus]